MKIIMLFTALLAGSCLAGAERAAQDDPCAGDAQKLCADARPGGGQIQQCLQKHAAELSAGCKKAIKSPRSPKGGRSGGSGGPGKGGPGGNEGEQGRERMKACKGSVEKFCGGAQPGESQVMECLKKHQAELPAECKAAMKKMRPPKKGKGAGKKDAAAPAVKQPAEGGEERGGSVSGQEQEKKALEACKAEIEGFCNDIEPGEGRVIQCLKSRQAELSEECQDVIKTLKPPQGGKCGGKKGPGPGKRGPGGEGPGGEGPGGEKPGNERPGGEGPGGGPGEDVPEGGSNG